MSPTNTPKDLTKQPPRSPRNRLGGYALMARMIDKGRAYLQGECAKIGLKPETSTLAGYLEADDVASFKS